LKYARVLKLQGDYDACLNVLVDVKNNISNLLQKQLATYEIALLLTQQNNASANEHLAALGFKFKLSPIVFCASLYSKAPRVVGDDHLVSAFDDVLPLEFLNAIREAFQPSSPFWIEHGYPTKDFFSYSIPNESEPSLLKQIITFLKPLVIQAFPHKHIDTSLESVEWWCHIRDESSGFAHQLHFDLDENALKTGDWTPDDLHPLVSSVLYLSDDDALPPTLVTNQRLNEGPATEAWLCEPRLNRLLVFDGALLHGVPPVLPPSFATVATNSSQSKQRLTLMLGWWDKRFTKHKSKSRGSNLSPNMQMPSMNSTTTLVWPSVLTPIRTDKSHMRLKHSKAKLLHIPGPIWVPVNESPSHTSDAVNMVSSSYLKELLRKQQISGAVHVAERIEPKNEIVFVGKWFIKSLEEIDNDVLGRKS
jgi:hypothetical protein